MSKQWNSSQLVEYLVAAGAKGRTRAALVKKFQNGSKAKFLNSARFKISQRSTRTIQEQVRLLFRPTICAHARPRRAPDRKQVAQSWCEAHDSLKSSKQNDGFSQDLL